MESYFNECWDINPNRKRTVLVIIGLIVGCAAKVSVSSAMLFNLYQGGIKDTLNYTQTQVELLSSMLLLGSVTGFLPGIFYDKYGTGWTSAAGLVITTGAYLLIWSTSESIEFYSNNPEIMAFYFYLAGFGTIFTYLTAVTTNLINFDDRHSGKIVGLLNSSQYVGCFFCVLIFYNFFTKETTTDDAPKYDIPGFMLFIAISSAVIHVLCILFLKNYENDSQYEIISNKHPANELQESSRNNGNKNVSECISTNNHLASFGSEHTYTEDKAYLLFDAPGATKYTDGNNEESSEGLASTMTKSTLTLKELLCTLDYHLVAWPFAITISAGFAYLANITVISESVHLDIYDFRLTSILHIASALSCAFSGYISDVLKEKLNCPRTVEVILGILCVEVSHALVASFADNLTVLQVSAALQGFGHSVVLNISTLVLNELFHPGNIGRNLGIMFMLIGFIETALQIAFGALYDIHVEQPGGGVRCYGLNCIRGGVLLSFLLVLLALVLSVWLHVRKSVIPK